MSIESGDFGYNDDFLPSGKNRKRFEGPESIYTFESVLEEGKKNLEEYFLSPEYKRKIENELKIEKYTGSDLTLDNFVEKTSNITLDPKDNLRVAEIINGRLQRLIKDIEVVSVQQIGFTEDGGNTFSPDFDGSISGFYYYGGMVGGKHYMGIKSNKDDKKFVLPEFGKVYIMDYFAYGETFGKKEDIRKSMISTVFHELGGHAVMDYDKNYTLGSSKIYDMMALKRKKDKTYSGYFDNKSEIQSRMMEFRDMLYLLGIIKTISEPIQEDQIRLLIDHYKKKGDVTSVVFLQKYTASQLITVMNSISYVSNEASCNVG